MGCDIHAHVEYREKGRDYWHSFASLGSEPRDYVLFGHFTNGEVRYSEVASGMISPRGVPSDIGSDAREDYFEDVFRDVDPARAEDEAEAMRKDLRARFGIEAEVHVAHMHSRTWGLGELESQPTLHTSISASYPCPDWHSASWLTTAELAATLEATAKHPLGAGRPDGYWWAVLASMRALSDQGHDCRIVFWFDN